MNDLIKANYTESEVKKNGRIYNGYNRNTQ